MSNVRILPLNSKPKRREIPVFVGEEYNDPIYGEGIVCFISVLMEGNEAVGYQKWVRYRNDPPMVVRTYTIKDYFKNAA